MAAHRARHCFAFFSKHLLECAGVPPSLKSGQSLSSQSSIAAISPGLSSGLNQRSFASGGAHNLPDDFARYQEHRTHKFSGLPTLLKAPLADTLEGLDIALVGVPFDGGASHPGTRFGPREIRNKSSMLRKIHGSTGVAPFSLCQVADVGDVVIKKPWNGVESAQNEIYDYFRQLCSRGIIPITAGGDHSISYPILRAVSEAAGGPVGLVHLDAHHDTVDLQESLHSTGSKFWNGTPFSCALADGLIDPKRTIQIGIRGPMSPGKMLSEEAGMRVVDMEEFYDLGPKKVAQEARQIVGDAPTYITFDVDALDPAYAIGTGSPEDGGLTTLEAQIILRGLRGLRFVGADFVCTSPPWDPTGNTPRVAANMIFEQLCLVAESIHRQRKQ